MSELTYLEAIRDGIREVMKEDKTVFLMGEDIGLYGGSFSLTNGLFAEFGEERVRDTPISEAAIIGASVGAAVTGMRPILEIMFLILLAVEWISFIIRLQKSDTCLAVKQKCQWF